MQFSNAMPAWLAGENVETTFTYADAIAPGRHRLTDINKPDVVFVGFNGLAWRTPANGNPRQLVGWRPTIRTVVHGDYWEE